MRFLVEVPTVERSSAIRDSNPNGSAALADQAKRDQAGRVAQGGRGRRVDRARVGSVPRITLGPDDAAAALGLCRRTFDDYVAPRLPVVRVGRRKLYRIAVLERWAEKNEAAPLG